MEQPQTEPNTPLYLEGYFFRLHAAYNPESVPRGFPDWTGIDPQTVHMARRSEVYELRVNLTDCLLKALRSAAYEVGIAQKSELSQSEAGRLADYCGIMWQTAREYAADLIAEEPKLSQVQNPLQGEEVVRAVWRRGFDRRRRVPSEEELLMTDDGTIL